MCITAQNQGQDAQSAWFKFNGNLKEAAGGAYTAVNHGSAFTSDRNGKANRAMQFDGSSSYISFASHTASDSIFDSFTFLCWINPFTFPANLIAKNEPMCNKNDFAVILNSNSISLTIGDTLCTISLNSSLNTNTWYHLAISWDGDSLCCFVNGILNGGLSCQASLIPIKKGLLIGKDFNSTQFLSGKLDDLRFYNYALDSAGMHSIYEYADTSAFIALAHPTGGESIKSGDACEIIWACNGISRVSIEYSTNGGTNWTNINSLVSADSGVYNWTAPSVISLNYKLRIRDVNTGELSTVSDSPFAVLDTVVYVSITVIPEGFYNPETNFMIPDTVTLSLWTVDTDYHLHGSAKVLLDTLGHGTAAIPGAVSGSYYLVVNHRNHLETWSASVINFTKGMLTAFDFTLSADSAYGANQSLKGTHWCLFGGDIDYNLFIDNDDLLMIDNDAYNYVTGYTITDVDGNNYVDAHDLIITDLNAYNFIGTLQPLNAKKYQELKNLCLLNKGINRNDSANGENEKREYYEWKNTKYISGIICNY